MKKVIDVSIGSIKFTLEEDAYAKLKDYFHRFELTIENKADVKEVMVDVEARVAELFQKEQEFSTQVINTQVVNMVIDTIGILEPARADYTNANAGQSHTSTADDYVKGEKKLYKDIDDKKISGVCSGLAAYLGTDPTFVRIAFAVLLVIYGATGWIYLILMIVVPKAITMSDKLKMRGYAVNAENLNRYASDQAL